MTITIEIEPKIEVQIYAAASANNLSVEEFVRKIVENNFVGNDAAEISLKEFERNLDSLTENFSTFPLVYHGTYSREDIYLEHD